MCTEELVKIGSWCVGRQQKQEALDYRVMKAQEVTEIEKALATDIRDLTKRRDELEAELNEVKGSLAAATSRHINIQEEKEQFDEASGHIVAQLSIRVCPCNPLYLANGYRMLLF
jgi:prefoldin subunit 5